MKIKEIYYNCIPELDNEIHLHYHHFILIESFGLTTHLAITLLAFVVVYLVIISKWYLLSHELLWF